MVGSKDEHKLSQPIVSLWLAKTTDDGRGFKVSPEMRSNASQFMVFTKDEANRVVSTLMKQRELRFLPCKDLEGLLFKNNKMF